MAKTCINHHNQTSVTMCHQCHNPLCKSCTMVTPHGTFCSSECSVLFREFKEKLKVGAGQKSSIGMKLVFLLLLGIAALIGIHVASEKGVGAVKKLDVIGMLLESAGVESPLKQK